MKTMWDGPCQREIRDRVARLSPEAKGEWGKMSAPQMVCHLADSLKMALGDLPVARKHLPIRYPPLKQFIMYVAPFPKSAPTAPELLSAFARRVERRRRRSAGARRSVRRARQRVDAVGRSIRRSAGCRAARGASSSTGTWIITCGNSERRLHVEPQSRRDRREYGPVLCDALSGSLRFRVYCETATWTTSARCCGTRWRRLPIAAARRCAARRRASPPTAPTARRGRR